MLTYFGIKSLLTAALGCRLSRRLEGSRGCVIPAKKARQHVSTGATVHVTGSTQMSAIKSFFTDLRYLLIGPAWLMAFLYRALGISY